MIKSRSMTCTPNKGLFNKLNDQEDIFLSDDNSSIDSILGRDDVSIESKDEQENQKISTIEKIKSPKKKCSFEVKIVNTREYFPYPEREMRHKALQCFLSSVMII